MRSAAWPSHRCGTRPRLARPVRISLAARRMPFGLMPPRPFVPSLTVIGRSVLSRTVRQGMPKAVVSSYIQLDVSQSQEAHPCVTYFSDETLASQKV